MNFETFQRVPVKITVIDHDDYLLEFEQTQVYKKTLVESEQIYENFLALKAKDNDCTNNGFACFYALLNNQDNQVISDPQFPFKIDNNGLLSTNQPLRHANFYDFKVRAFDCLNNDSYVDADVNVEVVETCVPQWTGILDRLLLDNLDLFY